MNAGDTVGGSRCGHPRRECSPPPLPDDDSQISDVSSSRANHHRDAGAPHSARRAVRHHHRSRGAHSTDPTTEAEHEAIGAVSESLIALAKAIGQLAAAEARRIARGVRWAGRAVFGGGAAARRYRRRQRRRGRGFGEAADVTNASALSGRHTAGAFMPAMPTAGTSEREAAAWAAEGSAAPQAGAGAPAPPVASLFAELERLRGEIADLQQNGGAEEVAPRKNSQQQQQHQQQQTRSRALRNQSRPAAPIPNATAPIALGALSTAASSSSSKFNTANNNNMHQAYGVGGGLNLAGAASASAAAATTSRGGSHHQSMGQAGGRTTLAAPVDPRLGSSFDASMMANGEDDGGAGGNRPRPAFLADIAAGGAISRLRRASIRSPGLTPVPGRSPCGSNGGASPETPADLITLALRRKFRNAKRDSGEGATPKRRTGRVSFALGKENATAAKEGEAEGDSSGTWE